MPLIIVESPTKAKTISQFLAKKYKVASSFGHIRDLPEKQMGVDIAHDFKPQYVIPPQARKTVASLKAAAKKADEVILASDEDREGEAIAWHLATTLDLKTEQTKRIVFHEITKEAILKALENPRAIDQRLVDAQQARRILDRLVGYELSPFLWKKVAKGLSAGRVQSVATRLIAEREREIQAFKSEKYWTLTATLAKAKNQDRFQADLYKINGQSFNKLAIKKERAQDLAKRLKVGQYQVFKIEKKQINKQPAPPFTTSTLQQSANRHLGFSAKQTMSAAQKLYEEGYITYMRTDSLNLAPKFLTEASQWLEKNLGAEYGGGGRVFKHKSKNAQEAHEAIRPTTVALSPEKLDGQVDKNQQRLYRLIWQRALASQMTAARLAATTIDVEATDKKDAYLCRATGQTLLFPGYLKIWPEKTKEQSLPALKEKENLTLLDLTVTEHATNPPARYSDASLVKELEKHGIGRPSTYAPTIATIIARNYVSRDENKKLKPTDIAFVVTDLLTKHFPKIVDYKFTAEMEDDLDEIARGEKAWVPVIAEFYDAFHDNLENKYQEIKKSEIMPEEKSTYVCDKCGAPMVIKTGRYGKFLACGAFPKCRNIKKLPGTENGNGDQNEPDKTLLELQEKYKSEVCDKCGSPMVVKTGRYGPFLACGAFPKCKNIKNISAGGKEITCLVCGSGKIVKKFSHRGAFWACSNYPNCKNAYWGEPTGEKCPDCGALLIKDRQRSSKMQRSGLRA